MNPALFKPDQIGIENLNERKFDIIGLFPTLLNFCRSCLNSVCWLNLIYFLSRGQMEKEYT